MGRYFTKYVTFDLSKQRLFTTVCSLLPPSQNEDISINQTLSRNKAKFTFPPISTNHNYCTSNFSTFHFLTDHNLPPIISLYKRTSVLNCRNVSLQKNTSCHQLISMLYSLDVEIVHISKIADWRITLAFAAWYITLQALA